MVEFIYSILDFSLFVLYFIGKIIITIFVKLLYVLILLPLDSFIGFSFYKLNQDTKTLFMSLFKLLVILIGFLILMGIDCPIVVVNMLESIIKLVTFKT
jgi:hypothetical protein